MKEHTQKPGVRKWAGDDMIALQAEPLSAIQGFFEEYGNCIVQGCEVVAAGNAYNVTTGLLALSGMDADGETTFKVVAFSGVESVTLPLYFTLTHSVVERAYADGKVKPIAYDYRAAVSAVKPADGVSFLELTATGGRRFVDAVKITEKLDKVGNGRDVTVTFATAASRENIASGERLGGMFGKVVKWFSDLKAVAFSGKMSDLTDDDTHRFVSDVEKQGWHDKYTRAETDTRDTAALQAAKEYAAAKIAEIVNSSPSTLDTLQELAAALGNDPNFATSIMALIAGKADNVHAHTTSQITDFPAALPANGGNADTVDGLHAAGSAVVPNHLASYFGDGSIHASYLYPENGADDSQAIDNIGIRNGEDAFLRFCSLERFRQALGTFITNRGSFGADELTTFTNRESGTYSVILPGVAFTLVVFKSTGSTSAVEILSGYEEDARLQVRKTIDSNRHTNFKDLAWLTDIPTSLPANGGNADTVGGSPAWRLQSVQKNGELYMANQYDIQSRFNAKEDGRFRLEIVGFGDANLHKDSVSVGYADVANNADTVDGKHADDFLASTNGVHTGALRIIPTSGAYAEGIRISRLPGAWANIQLGADANAATGKIDNQWIVGTNPAGAFMICLAGMESEGVIPANGFGLSPNNEGAYFNRKRIATTDEIPTSDLGGIGSDAANWDTFTTPGANWTNPMGWGTNAPDTPNMNGLLIVSRSGNCIVQCYEPSGATGAFKRVQSIDGYWSDWKQCAMKSDIPATTAQLTEVANKKFVTDAEKTKIDNSLEVICAGVIDANGGVQKKRGNFNTVRINPGRIAVDHDFGTTDYIVITMDSTGKTSNIDTPTSASFIINIVSPATNTRFVMYKI